MECDFDVCRALGVPAVAEGQPPAVARVEESHLEHPKWGQQLRALLDKIGERSRRAQGLGKAVTDGRGPSIDGHRVYLLAAGKSALGVLKVGTKKLYVAKSANDGLQEINPLCVLDFYVVEGHQRGGLGRRLFGGMLSREGASADRLAYDKPSPKLIGFLRKHFNLAKYHEQSNKFVVFDAYWTSGARRASDAARGAETNPAANGRGGRGGYGARGRSQSGRPPRRAPAAAEEASVAVGPEDLLAQGTAARVSAASQPPRLSSPSVVLRAGAAKKEEEKPQQAAAADTSVVCAPATAAASSPVSKAVETSTVTVATDTAAQATEAGPKNNCLQATEEAHERRASHPAARAPLPAGARRSACGYGACVGPSNGLGAAPCAGAGGGVGLQRSGAGARGRGVRTRSESPFGLAAKSALGVGGAQQQQAYLGGRCAAQQSSNAMVSPLVVAMQNGLRF